MASLTKPTLESVHSHKKHGLLRLEDVIVKSSPSKNLPSIDKKGYNVQEVIGKDELAPSLKKLLDEKESRALLKYAAEKAESKVACKLAAEIAKNAPELAQEFSEKSRAKPDVPQWKDRDKMARKEDGSRISPVDWIHIHYGNRKLGNGWKAMGLTQADIRTDLKLYNVYLKWIGSHPDDNLNLLVVKRRKVADAEETLKNRRIRSLESYHRQK